MWIWFSVILISVGGIPNKLNIPGHELAWTSDDVFNLMKFPESLTIVGGGYIACATQAVKLSGGQQQMLAIGRGLMLRPKLMLLDEPSLGLSPKLVSEISEIILRLNKEQGVTILLVEQNAKMALDIGDYGFVMELGRIVMEDSCSRLKASTDIQEFYLGMKDEGVRGRRRWKQRKTWR